MPLKRLFKDKYDGSSRERIYCPNSVRLVSCVREYIFKKYMTTASSTGDTITAKKAYQQFSYTASRVEQHGRLRVRPRTRALACECARSLRAKRNSQNSI